jgi:hypothetical protein
MDLSQEYRYGLLVFARRRVSDLLCQFSTGLETARLIGEAGAIVQQA